METLTGTMRHYSWGSTDAIAHLLNVEPTGEPVAEYWLGAHPLSPSRLGQVGLADHLTAHPEDLGARSRERFGDRLPFLLKVLAAAHPLSLQAHPDAEQARAGFAAENARGIPLDADDRTYRDDWPKPELFVALSDFEALCGFRDPHLSRRLFDSLGVRVSLDPVLGPLTERRGAAGLAEVFLDCLAPVEERRHIVEEVVAAAVNHVDDEGEAGQFARTAVELDELHPGDPSIMAALLLNRVHLEPGQAIHVWPGLMHAYLHGTGIEVMANSDNVVRGGITDKHIDVDALIRIVSFTCDPLDVVTPVQEAPGLWRYPTDTEEFRLWRVDLDASAPVILPATDLARVMLLTGGYAVCSSAAGTEEIVQGTAVWVPAGEQVQVDGNCDAFLAAAGL